MKLTVCLDVSEEAGQFLSKYCATTGLSFDKAVSLIVENLPTRFDNNGNKIKDKSPIKSPKRSTAEQNHVIEQITKYLKRYGNRTTVELRKVFELDPGKMKSTLRIMQRRKLIEVIGTERGVKSPSIVKLRQP